MIVPIVDRLALLVTWCCLDDCHYDCPYRWQMSTACDVMSKWWLSLWLSLSLTDEHCLWCDVVYMMIVTMIVPIVDRWPCHYDCPYHWQMTMSWLFLSLTDERCLWRDGPEQAERSVAVCHDSASGSHIPETQLCQQHSLDFQHRQEKIPFTEKESTKFSWKETR